MHSRRDRHLNELTTIHIRHIIGVHNLRRRRVSRESRAILLRRIALSLPRIIRISRLNLDIERICESEWSGWVNATFRRATLSIALADILGAGRLPMTRRVDINLHVCGAGDEELVALWHAAAVHVGDIEAADACKGAACVGLDAYLGCSGVKSKEKYCD
jgi:hypothetical protein